MKCAKCGSEMGDEKKCPNCGADTTEQNSNGKNPFKNVRDFTNEFDVAEAKDKKTMAVLSYIGLLVLIPIFACKDNKYVRFHANQGLVICVGEVISVVLYEILIAIFWRVFVLTSILTAVFWILSVCFTVLAIIGIINAVNEKAKELPLVGKIRIIK